MSVDSRKYEAHVVPLVMDDTAVVDWVPHVGKTVWSANCNPHSTSLTLLTSAIVVSPSRHGWTESMSTLSSLTVAGRATTSGSTVTSGTEPNTAMTTSLIPTPGTGDDPSTPTTDGSSSEHKIGCRTSDMYKMVTPPLVPMAAAGSGVSTPVWYLVSYLSVSTLSPGTAVAASALHIA